jgi:hypothetical protein
MKKKISKRMQRQDRSNTSNRSDVNQQLYARPKSRKIDKKFISAAPEFRPANG